MQGETGVSLIETLAVTTIFGLLVALAVPSFQEYSQTLRLTEEMTDLARALTEIRAESLRLRRSTTLTFSSSGFSWDTAGDAVPINGSFSLRAGSEWQGLVPEPFAFNGLGLTRSNIPQNEYRLIIRQGNLDKGVSINRNGYISILP